jgi:hypothetical protein
MRSAATPSPLPVAKVYGESDNDKSYTLSALGFVPLNRQSNFHENPLDGGVR